MGRSLWRWRMVRTALRGRGRRRSEADTLAADVGLTRPPGQDGPDGYCSLGDAGAAATATRGAPRVAAAEHALGRRGNAALRARRLGNRLHIFSWIAEDSRLLRTSIINFLDQLSLVIQTMQHFGPPLSR